MAPRPPQDRLTRAAPVIALGDAGAAEPPAAPA
jgi:hypothetical protein